MCDPRRHSGKSQGPKLTEAGQTANISNHSKYHDLWVEYADFDGLLWLLEPSQHCRWGLKQILTYENRFTN
jgi:hypothetical protein